MKRNIKKQLLSLTDTLNEAHEYITDQIANKNTEAVISLLKDCQDSAVKIGTTIEQYENGYRHIVEKLEKYCDMLYQLGQALENSSGALKLMKKISKSIDIIANNIKYDIKCEIEVLFLPYKASMWTSLESIWKAASMDPDCNAVVMPIPYFNIGDPSNITEEYEGDLFPKDVQITDYRNYDIAKRHPDAIIIHNPYDDNNILTRVHPNFFSSRLKEHTDCLVYSPYFTYGNFIPGKSDYQYLEPGTVNADKIIIQSEKVKKIFKTYGFSDDKLIVSGSPKIDAIVKLNSNDMDMPEKWKEKLGNKKIFLLNTHLTYFPASFTNTTKSGNYGVRFHNEILKAILDRKDVGLIWRPHPLMNKMISAKYPECLDYIDHLEKTISNSSNCVIDNTADYRPAFVYSDAMISTWSSLINEYMVLGKPVMIFQTQPSGETRARSPIDRGLNYYRFGPGGMRFEDFIDMVVEGKDPLYEARMNMINQAFRNLDGTAGENAYAWIKSELSKCKARTVTS